MRIMDKEIKRIGMELAEGRDNKLKQIIQDAVHGNLVVFGNVDWEIFWDEVWKDVNKKLEIK